MPPTPGLLSLTAKTDTTASLVSAPATGGTPPYTYQWYRSTVSGFTPGPGNIIDGATELTLEDSGLIPNTTYFYVVKVTDDAAGADDSAELEVLTDPMTLSPNQFAQTPTVGMVDQRFNYNTRSVIIDAAQTTPLYAGMAVKFVDPPSGAGNVTPRVVGCTADDDDVAGFIQFSPKDRSFVAGMACEISMDGNVQYLFATEDGSTGEQAILDLATGGGVKPAAGSGGANIVGWFFDQPIAGQLCRVSISTPSFRYDE